MVNPSSQFVVLMKPPHLPLHGLRVRWTYMTVNKLYGIGLLLNRAAPIRYLVEFHYKL